MKIGVLGGGVSGLAFASMVKGAEVLEKEKEFGGLLRSIKEQGYTFDLGSHIIFSKNKQVLDYMLGLLGDNKIQHKRNTKIFYKDRLVKYPFENGLGDLPKEEAYECVLDYTETYVKREKGELPTPSNFKDWMFYRFGKGITEKYLYPYNLKVWDYPPEKMDLFWVEGRVPQPPLKDVISAGMGMESEGYTHQSIFHYPARGGLRAVSDAIKAKKEPHRLHRHFEGKKVKKENGKWMVTGPEERIYDRLVNTFHINDFIRTYADVPGEVKEAAASLRWNSIYIVMIGINKPKISDLHWAYMPDKEVLPNRISYISNYSPYTVPEGHSSILAEITFDPEGKKAKMTDKEVLERTIEDL